MSSIGQLENRAIYAAIHTRLRQFIWRDQAGELGSGPSVPPDCAVIKHVEFKPDATPRRSADG